jgi:O-acetyl-ADP-ribose deacetylase (regulator of RNase III)
MLFQKYGDIIHEKSDIIVSSASFNRQVGSGVEESIHDAAGPRMTKDYTKQLAKVVKITHNTLIVTNGGSLSKQIYHVYAPHVNMWNSNYLLFQIYKNIFSNLVKSPYKSVSIPLLGCGKNKISIEDSYKMLVHAYEKSPKVKNLDITVVFYSIHEYTRILLPKEFGYKQLHNMDHYKFEAKDVQRIRVCHEATEAVIKNIYLPKAGCLIVDVK